MICHMGIPRRFNLAALSVLAGYKSRAELARECDISLSYIYSIRKGYKPSAAKLARLAAALAVPEARIVEAIRRD